MVKENRNHSVDKFRASVTFPKTHHEFLERIAEEKKVSVAWDVREAVNDCPGARWPLLKPHTTYQ